MKHLIIFVVAEEYVRYRRFMQSAFPYFQGEGPFVFVKSATGEDFTQCAGAERGTPYFLLSGSVPDWFARRFRRIELSSVTVTLPPGPELPTP